MGAYSYKALNETGKTVKGIIEADSERHVRSQLRAKKLKPLEVENAHEQPQKASDDSLDLSGWRKRWASRLSNRDLSIITRQLASLVRSGLPLDEALHATGIVRKPVRRSVGGAHAALVIFSSSMGHDRVRPQAGVTGRPTCPRCCVKFCKPHEVTGIEPGNTHRLPRRFDSQPRSPL